MYAVVFLGYATVASSPVYSTQLNAEGVAMYLTDSWNYRSPRSVSNQAVENEKREWRETIVANQNNCVQAQCSCRKNGKDEFEKLIQETSCLITAVAQKCTLMGSDSGFLPLSICDSSSDMKVIAPNCKQEDIAQGASEVVLRSEALAYVIRLNHDGKRAITALATIMEQMEYDSHLQSIAVDARLPEPHFALGKNDNNQMYYAAMAQYAISLHGSARIYLTGSTEISRLLDSDIYVYPDVQTQNIDLLQALLQGSSAVVIGQLASSRGRVLYELHALFSFPPNFMDRMEQLYEPCPFNRILDWKRQKIGNMNATIPNQMLVPLEDIQKSYQDILN